MAGPVHKYTVDFLISEGLDVNKKDNNGRTPLFYLLSCYDPTEFSNDRIESFLSAGGTLVIPEGDEDFCSIDGSQRMTLMTRYVLALETINIHAMNVKDAFECLMSAQLRHNEYADLVIDLYLEGIYKSYERFPRAREVYMLLFLLTEKICFELDISRPHPHTHFIDHIDTMKFMISGAHDMGGNIIENLMNYLGFSVFYRLHKSMEYLLPVLKPDHVNQIMEAMSLDAKAQEIVDKWRRTPMSLKNKCRLKIHESFNIDAAVERVPKSLQDFIKFKFFMN